MKKITAIILLLCFIFMTSCKMIQFDFLNREYDPASISADDYPFAKKTALEVIRCLDNKDAQGLKSLLSESVLLQADIDNQIEELFELYKGQSLSHNEIEQEIAASSSNEGRYIYKSIRITVRNLIIDTDTNKKYILDLYYVLVDNENPLRVGLSEIIFKDSKGYPLLKLFEEKDSE